MNIKLAAETPSATNANIFSNYYGPKTTQTTLYWKHMNNFFRLFEWTEQKGAGL